MCIHHLFATSLGPLALNEMLVVKVIVPDGWTTVYESVFLKREPLIDNTVWPLPHLHKEWKLIIKGKLAGFNRAKGSIIGVSRVLYLLLFKYYLL
jgi:hypothetical protein